MEPSTRTLHAYLRDLALLDPEKTTIGNDSGWITAATLLSTVEATAADFVHLGIRSTDFVGVRCHRTQDTVITILALQAIGAVAVLTDPRQSVDDFLSRCGVSIPVIATIDRSLLTDKRTGRQNYLNSSPSNRRSFSEKNVDPRAPGLVIFTSGSTGTSKAVILSQYNLINNLIDSQPLGCYSESDIALGALPLDHVFGLVLMAGVPVLRYSLYLPERTDISSLLQSIEANRITRMNGVPSLYLAMVDKKGAYDLSSLRAGFIGGGPCTAEQFKRIEYELSMTLIPVYGMSECVGVACGNYLDPQNIRCDGVGAFYSMNNGKILLADGSEAPTGQIGEICVDGPSRMVGYYGDTQIRPSLLHTGDLGYVDARGILHISGRKKDIIIRNGVNLSPLRIEQALVSIPGIQAAAVVGLPDEKAGELPWAMIVCNSNAPDHVETSLLTKLNRNEIPAGFYRAPFLPMTASGKVDKQKIREVLAAWKA